MPNQRNVLGFDRLHRKSTKALDHASVFSMNEEFKISVECYSSDDVLGMTSQALTSICGVFNILFETALLFQYSSSVFTPIPRRSFSNQ